MAQTLSTMLALGSPAPDFSLPDTNGRIVSLKDFSAAPALLVMFLCNHCPYVKHIQAGMTQMAKDFQARGVAVAGISANDAVMYPDDSPEKMALEARQAGYTFPYLYDESQTVAQAYRAACTPDFFLFDQARKLVYRGQMDAARRRNPIPVTGETLRQAVDQLLAGQPITVEQIPSLGCNIKWKPGKEPDYFRLI